MWLSFPKQLPLYSKSIPKDAENCLVKFFRATDCGHEVLEVHDPTLSLKDGWFPRAQASATARRTSNTHGRATVTCCLLSGIAESGRCANPS
jgi:hypothetical protein